MRTTVALLANRVRKVPPGLPGPMGKMDRMENLEMMPKMLRHSSSNMEAAFLARRELWVLREPRDVLDRGI